MIPRYKLIVIVHIGQRKSQSILIGSRCLWDPKSDTFSSSVFRNSSLFALASVYAVYFEWLKINQFLLFLNQNRPYLCTRKLYCPKVWERNNTNISNNWNFWTFLCSSKNWGREGRHRKDSCLSRGGTKSWFCWIVPHRHGFLLLVLIILIALYSKNLNFLCFFLMKRS